MTKTETELPFHREETSPVVDFPLRVTEYGLWGLLTSALEGGVSRNWIAEVGVRGKRGASAPGVYLQDWPFLGATLLVRVGEDPGDVPRAPIPGKKTIWALDRQAILDGLRVFASLKKGEGGHHFPNFLSENDDAETGDVFLQCCLFGALVFG